MMKSLFILILLLYSCGTGSINDKPKQDTVSRVKSEQPSLSAISRREIVDSNFLFFWKEFTTVVKNNNKEATRNMTFDSLECEGKEVDVNTFMNSYFSEIFDQRLLTALSDKSKLDFISSEIDPSYIQQSIIKRNREGKYLERTVNVTTKNTYPPVIIIFTFIETINGYKLYAYDRIG